MDDTRHRTTATDWTVIQIEVPEALADAAGGFLADEGLGVLVHDPGPAHRTLEVHVPAPEADPLADRIGRWLRSVATLEPAAAAARVSMAPLPALDWEAVFRAHHRPLPVGERLLVAPPWDVPTGGSREVLVIEPGMAFGTGQHETTRTCLEEIDAATATGGIRAALDVGTGTGVLAAALARLGVARVVALDADPSVLPLARENLRCNRAQDVRLVAGRAAAIAGRFDLVVANLLAGTLIAEAATLAPLVGAGGRLVVSGVLESQAADVIAAFSALRHTASRAAGPWRTIRLEP